MRDENSENILRALEHKEIEELENRVAAFEDSKKANQLKKKEKLSHAVQILILEYLDFGKNIDKNTIKAEIYALLIQRDIETTRQFLSGINESKTIKNLEIIAEYFNKAGYPDIVKVVEKDINRIKKKR
jgi:hypothetical protein